MNSVDWKPKIFVVKVVKKLEILQGVSVISKIDQVELFIDTL